jgi:hypothetical protein
VLGSRYLVNKTFSFSPFHLCYPLLFGSAEYFLTFVIVRIIWTIFPNLPHAPLQRGAVFTRTATTTIVGIADMLRHRVTHNTVIINVVQRIVRVSIDKGICTHLPVEA